MAGGTAATGSYMKWKAARGKVITQLKSHPLFRMHEDVELHICCSDPIRSDLFTYIKDKVILEPVQVEIGYLLSSWTDLTFSHEVGNANVCDRLNRALDNITRLHTQKGREIPEIEAIIFHLLLPFHQSTFRSLSLGSHVFI